MKRLKFSEKLLAAVLFILVLTALFFKKQSDDTVLTVNGIKVPEEEYAMFYQDTKSGIPASKTREEITIRLLTEYKVEQEWAGEMGVAVTEDFNLLKKEWEEDLRKRRQSDSTYGKEYDLKEYVGRRRIETLYEMRQIYLKQSQAEGTEQSEEALRQFDMELERRISEANVKRRGRKWKNGSLQI